MFYCITKKRVTIISAILVAIIAVSLILGLVVSKAMPTLGKAGRKLPVYSVSREEKVIALTFDAAWGADKTKDIVDIMNKHSAKGTFFLVGFWIDKYQDEVKMISDNGFEIGNHSRNHLKMSSLSQDDIHRELSYVNTNVKKLTDKDIKVFRPPFGDYNDRLVQGSIDMGMMPIQWDVDSLDWKGITGDEITRRVMSKVKNGSIVLFHNNSDHILDALPSILTQLISQGFSFATVSDLLFKDNYIIDNNGRQQLAK